MINYIRTRMTQIVQENKLTYCKVADLCDIPRSTLNNYLSGKTIPSIPAVEQFCKGFNMDFLEFFAPYIQENTRGKSKEYLTILEIFESIPQEDKELFCKMFLILFAFYSHHIPTNII